MINRFQTVTCIASLLAMGTWTAAPAQDGEKGSPGPAVGERIPPFEAPDQTGKRQTFESLKGPHGLALLVVRSADW